MPTNPRSGFPPTPLALQPPPDDGQHRPEPPPVSRQSKLLGQVLAAGLQLVVQKLLLPSLPHCVLAQSSFAPHVVPRPPVSLGPTMQAPSMQMSPARVQSVSVEHGLPNWTLTVALVL